jgi:hypothetical protein
MKQSHLNYRRQGVVDKLTSSLGPICNNALGLLCYSDLSKPGEFLQDTFSLRSNPTFIRRRLPHAGNSLVRCKFVGNPVGSGHDGSPA